MPLATLQEKKKQTLLFGHTHISLALGDSPGRNPQKMYRLALPEVAPRMYLFLEWVLESVQFCC